MIGMNGIWRKTFRWLDCMYFVAQNSTKEPYKSRATTSASVLKGETWEWETSNNQKKGLPNSWPNHTFFLFLGGERRTNPDFSQLNCSMLVLLFCDKQKSPLDKIFKNTPTPHRNSPCLTGGLAALRLFLLAVRGRKKEMMSKAGHLHMSEDYSSQ